MKRSITFLLAPIIFLLVGACAPTTQEEMDAEKADKVQEHLKDHDRQRDNLGMALDSEGWDDGENTFSVGKGAGASHYAIVGSGEVKCYAKFQLIVGEGSGREQQETSSQTFVGITANFEGEGEIPLESLPEAFKNEAVELTQARFEELVRQTRDSNPAVKEICGDSD